MLINFNRFFQPPPQQTRLNLPEIQALVMHLGRGRKVSEITPLEGGYRNHNYQVDFANGDVAVLKVSTDLVAAQKATALQQQLSRFLPVPEILGERATSAHVFTLMSYVPGRLACTVPKDLEESDYLEMGRSIGAFLARVHKVQLPAAGTLNADLEVVDPYANLGDSWLAYMREVMHGKRAEARLGAEDCQRVLQLLNRYEQRLHDLSPTHCLVHSDFNLKNIKVEQKNGQWRVAGVLDWEFAHGGSPLTDLGNFYRFEQQLPTGLFKGFETGYFEQGYGVQADRVEWRDLARILDLTALCNFLDAPEERPLTEQTAVTKIRETLDTLQ